MGPLPEGPTASLQSPIRPLDEIDLLAGLRCHSLTAPFVVDAPMNRRILLTYAETQPASALEKGDVVSMDNLSAHKSPAAEKAIKAKGVLWFLFLPPYSSGLNPIAPSAGSEGLRKTQGPSACLDHRRPLASNRSNLRPVRTRRMPKLLRHCRLRCNLSEKRSRAC